jgi:hypothetical protein
MVNFYYVYYTINAFLLVNVSFSQISLLLAVLLGDICSVTIVNGKYIFKKVRHSVLHDISETDTLSNESNEESLTNV